MANKRKQKCGMCQGGGALQSSEGGHVYPCGACGGSGEVERPQVGPQDYVFNYAIPTPAQEVSIPVQILSYDFLLKWLVADGSGVDTVMVKDNRGYQWMNEPINLDNWAGSAQWPFPMQPNVFLAKNSALTITVNGVAGDAGQIVLRGINLEDPPAAA
jgi:hypothetical protein